MTGKEGKTRIQSFGKTKAKSCRINTMNEATIPYGRRPRLQNLYNFFELPPFNQTHRALDDVNMLIACYDEMKKRKWI